MRISSSLTAGVFGGALLISLSPVVVAQQPVGKFHGKVVVEWIEDPGGPDRQMKVREEFRFEDASGKEWKVPMGAVIDGASIPRVFWNTVGPPFVGDYRRASVVHDYYCHTKEATWRSTHRMFYDGLLAAGIPLVSAKVMYAAVYGGGPRWTPIAGAEPGQPQFMTVTPDLTEEDLRELQEWIEADDPGLRELEGRVEAAVQP
jgi:hypothetical protein